MFVRNRSKICCFLIVLGFFSTEAKAQNSPFLIWGAGLDGTTYQTSAVYSTASTGLALEAPLSSSGSKLPIQFGWRGGGVALKIFPDGNIGIGTTDSKGYKLAVAGSMIAESIKVKLQSAWPDFVFSKAYTLPTLKETEAHIQKKGHLPGIPSAADVKANGVNLGQMNAMLLQKIEELTLHLIEKEKEIDQLKLLKDKVIELDQKIMILQSKLTPND